MRNKNVIGVLILIVGFTGSSQAGFRDALKSAAGGALNDLTGVNPASGETTTDAAKIKSDTSVTPAAPTEIKDCVVKDESSISKERFMKANNFSEAEYLQWLGAVTKELAGTRTPVSGIPAEGIVFDNYRLTLPPDEASKVFRITADGGILLSQEYAYFLSGNTCLKFNYATLAAGKCDERGDVLRNPEAGRVIYSIEESCDSAKKKISGEKYEKAALVATMEREKREAAEAQEREQQRKQEEDRIAAEKAKEKQVAAQKQEESQKQIKAILAWDDSSAKAKAATMKNKTIVFKSLYLGMPAEDAYKIIYRALSRTILSQMGGHDAISVCAKGSMFVGSAGEVIAINLDAIAVNALFDSDRQDASVFVETFIKAYGIPRMNPSDDFSSWTYTSPDGAKLTIDTQKNILLEKVASKKEQKKNFD
jgi:hypothetical protein